MRRRPFGLLVGLAATAISALGLGAVAGPAAAQPVLVLTPGIGARLHDDPFLTGPAVTPAPPAVATAARAANKRRPPRTPISELGRLYRSHALTRAAYRYYNRVWSAALAAQRRLQGTRADELGAVIANVRAIAAAGLLTPSRLPALLQTVLRNRQWWSSGPLLSSGDRVEFSGSQLVWEYYPGQGIELQVLGSFGKADGLFTGGPAYYPRLAGLLAELIPLAARRGGGATWEYYFNFDGGAPPWTSAMSQGTALEALSRAYRAFGDPRYLALAAGALPIFSVPPPVGVAVRTQRGTRYLQYSFAPGASIINAFLQTLIGLYDYAHVSGDPRAAKLFAAGDAEARSEVPQFDTGAWSLYQPGLEDTLDYHTLVTGFLQQLCARTGAAVYCATAQRFTADLTTPPALTLLTGSVPVGHPSQIRFRLSKFSQVGIVIARGSQTVFLTSAEFPYGVGSFSIPPLNPRGSYSLHLAATDLAGNFNRLVTTLQVS